MNKKYALNHNSCPRNFEPERLAYLYGVSIRECVLIHRTHWSLEERLLNKYKNKYIILNYLWNAKNMNDYRDVLKEVTNEIPPQT